MAKLSRIEAKNHKAALKILEQDILSSKDKEFVFANYHEGAHSINGDAGAFFTPLALALEIAFDCGNNNEDQRNFIDLCAGIGVLTYALIIRYPYSKFTCVEMNPEYVAIGKKLVPEADWYCMDVNNIDDLAHLGRFDTAVSNPPYGKIPTLRHAECPKYTGGEAEYKILDLASKVANNAVFLIPQTSAGFVYSGVQFYDRRENSKYNKFIKETGFELEAGAGIDTTVPLYEEPWKNVTIPVEIICVELPEVELVKEIENTEIQYELF